MKADTSHTRRTLAQHGVAVFGTGIAISAANFVTGVLVARLLGPEGRGEVAAAVLYYIPLAYLAGLGIPQGHAFLVARDESSAHHVYANSAIVGAGLGTVFGAIGWISLPYLLAAQSEEVVRLAQLSMLATPIIVILGMVRPVLQGLHRFELDNAHRTLKTAGYLVALVVLAILSAVYVEAVVAAHILVPTVLSAVYLERVRRKLGLSWRGVSVGLMRDALSFGSRAQAGYALSLLSALLAPAVVANQLDADSVGLFAVATSGAGLLLALQNPFNLILMPAVARSEGPVALIARAFRLGTIFFGGFAVVLLVAGDLVVTTLFGHEFTGAVLPMQILAFGYGALGLVDILDRACEGLGKPVATAFGRAVGIGVTGMSLGLLVGRYGIHGAAIAFVTGSIANTGVMLVMLRRAGGPMGRIMLPTPRDLTYILRAIMSFRRRASH